MMRGNTEPARRLRRNQTDAGRLLWFRLRDRRLEGWKFKRQVPIERFVVDFFCADAKLIVELDGGQHIQNSERDADRTRVLESMGYLVLRFWNHDLIRNTDGVLEEILSTINQLRSEPPHPTPLQPKSGLPDFGQFKFRTRASPSSGGERERT
jgi:very-short-patch-repair endonuclease